MTQEEILAEYEKIMNENPFGSFLGIELIEIRKGYVKTRVKRKKVLENIYGDIHGGVLFSIADNMAGIAASTYGYYVTTVDGSINYLKAARNTDYVICEAKAVKAGKTISVIAVDIFDQKGMLINTANFTYYNLREKENPIALEE